MSALDSIRRILAENSSRKIEVSDSPFQTELDQSVEYLKSAKAIESIRIDTYWPKWDSPWWHMSVLFEMGLAKLIPIHTAEIMLEEIRLTHRNYFFDKDAPSDLGPKQVAPCPCAFGNIYQILSATGLEVDQALPWARNWFLNYQMPDGGLNCNEAAYHSGEMNASSMVGTIAPLEALLYSVKDLSEKEISFLHAGAKCLLNRELRLGSKSKQNAEEVDDEKEWLKLCFPRFYFYDVLRGLNFILDYSEKFQQKISAESILSVISAVQSQSQNGSLRTQRRSFEGVGTRVINSQGKFERKPEASHYPLIDQLSAPEQMSSVLTQKWQNALKTLENITNSGWIE